MSNVLPEIEISDELGFTEVLVGTVNASPSLFPAVATTNIDEFLIHCPVQTPGSVRLSWSLDNVTYFEMAPGEVVGITLRQHPTLGYRQQIYLKGSTTGVKYQVVINRKDV